MNGHSANGAAKHGATPSSSASSVAGADSLHPPSKPSSSSTSVRSLSPLALWKRRQGVRAREMLSKEQAASTSSSSAIRDAPPSDISPRTAAETSDSYFRMRSPRGSFPNFWASKSDSNLTQQLHPLLTAQYPDEEAVGAFIDALVEDHGQQAPPLPGQGFGSAAWTKLGLPSLRSPPLPSASNPSSPIEEAEPAAKLQHPQTGRKVGKIAAVSDFAPVRERTRRGTRAVDTGRREGLVYNTLRWPLLLIIFLTIGLEFAAYVFTRQVVNVVEWLIAHRGRKGVLRSRMRKCKGFEEWKEAALRLDDFMGHEKWKKEDASGLYDWILVKKVHHSLKTFREQDDVQELMAVIELCCRNNFAGTENFRLYSETYFGTKHLVEEYLSELERCLDYIKDSDKLSPEQKRTFYRSISKNLGKSGLCLSGGGAFGYYHVGLVKALLDSKLLPRIVSGTSAGGLIAALTCTRTDEELSNLLVPELADRITACEEPLRVWAKRAWQTGARFDPKSWAEKAAFFTMGSLTFREAYERTGKTLNISVIPSEKNSPVKLLNYLTAPRCVIWSALLASAAVPGLLPPVCLMQKSQDGQIVPWNFAHRFRDGSLRVDIPLQDLHSMFRVNYPIVSQVNPHVHLFFFAPKGMPGRPVAHRKGKGWRGGFILSASEHVLKLHLSLNFKIIRDLDLLPAILGTDWSGVFLQQFGGAVTIWPKTRFLDWIHILSDPDRQELARMIRVGLSATWPKLHMIENRMRLERAIERGRRASRHALRQQARSAAAASGSSSRGDRPHPDSGTDHSLAATPGVNVFSDTDGEHHGDYFAVKALRGGGRGNNGAAARGAFAADIRRRLGKLPSALTTPGTPMGDGGTTPGGEEGMTTPGELPMSLRTRSMGMSEVYDDDDDEDDSEQEEEEEAEDEEEEALEQDTFHAAEGDTSADFSMSDLRRPSAASAADEFFEDEGDQDDSYGGGNTTVMPDLGSKKKALTAAALTPRAEHSAQRAQRGSSSGGGRGSSRSRRRFDDARDHFTDEGGRRGSSGGVGSGAPTDRPSSQRLRVIASAAQPSSSTSSSQEWSTRGSFGATSPWDDEAEAEAEAVAEAEAEAEAKAANSAGRRKREASSITETTTTSSESDR